MSSYSLVDPRDRKQQHRLRVRGLIVMIENRVVEKRKHRRESTWQAIKVLVDGKVFVCDLIQISNSGAALELGHGMVVRPNCKIELTFMNDTKVSGKIVWVRSGKIGVSFDVNFLSHEDFLHYDYMGYDQYRHLIQLQKLRTAAS